MKPLKGFEEFTEEQLAAMTLPDDAETVYDEDNPPWTRERIERSISVDDLPLDEKALILAAFPNTKFRGKQKAPTKVPVSLRLPPDILEHFKANNPGWQARIEAALRESMKKAG